MVYVTYIYQISHNKFLKIWGMIYKSTFFLQIGSREKGARGDNTGQNISLWCCWLSWLSFFIDEVDYHYHYDYYDHCHTNENISLIIVILNRLRYSLNLKANTSFCVWSINANAKYIKLLAPQSGALISTAKRCS